METYCNDRELSSYTNIFRGCSSLLTVIVKLYTRIRVDYFAKPVYTNKEFGSGFFIALPGLLVATFNCVKMSSG